MKTGEFDGNPQIGMDGLHCACHLVVVKPLLPLRQQTLLLTNVCYGSVCLVIILIEEREPASWFPSLVVPIDNLPFVFFRIVVGGQWALLTPQLGRLLNVIQP